MVKFLPQSASLNGSDILSTRFKSVKKTFYKILYQHLKRDGNIAVTIWKRRNYAGFSPLTYLALILIGAFKVIFLLHFMESFQASFHASSQSCGGMLWNSLGTVQVLGGVEWSILYFNPTDTSMVTKSPRIGVGLGFDSKGSVTFFHKYCFPNLHWIHLKSRPAHHPEELYFMVCLVMNTIETYKATLP